MRDGSTRFDTDLLTSEPTILNRKVPGKEDEEEGASDAENMSDAAIGTPYLVRLPAATVTFKLEPDGRRARATEAAAATLAAVNRLRHKNPRTTA